MATEPRGCMFCGGRPLTKTHLIAENSIRAHLPSTGATTRRHNEWLDEAGPRRKTLNFDADPLVQWVKRACEPCNRDWMNSIELDVASDVIALALGRPGILTPGRASRLALWALIVSLLRDTQTDGPGAVDESLPRWVRENSRMPPGFTAHLIRSDEPRWDFPNRHRRVMTFDTRESGYFSYFGIGEAIFFIADPVVNLAGGYPAMFPQAAVRIDSNDAAAWPPARTVSHAALFLTTSFVPKS